MYLGYACALSLYGRTLSDTDLKLHYWFAQLQFAKKVITETWITFGKCVCGQSPSNLIFRHESMLNSNSLTHTRNSSWIKGDWLRILEKKKWVNELYITVNYFSYPSIGELIPIWLNFKSGKVFSCTTAHCTYIIQYIYPD